MRHHRGVRSLALIAVIGCHHAAHAIDAGPVAFTATLGAEENVIPPSTPGLLFVPDEHLSYRRLADGTYDLWMSNGGTLMFTTPDLVTLTSVKTSGGVPVGVLQPAGAGTTAYDADYAGAGSVLVAANGDLLMIYHAENHLYGTMHYAGVPFYASIALARSSDGGMTWTRAGQIITGHDPQQASQPATGAGALTPSAIAAADGFLYVMYREIDLQSQTTGLALARAPIASDAAPGSWQKLYQGAFTEPGLGGSFTALPIVLDPSSENDRRQPFVTFDAYLGAYVLAVVGNGGIYLATSRDLVTWAPGQVILPAPVPDGTVTPTTAPYNWYPTLVSPDQASETTTDQTGYLYYAKGANDGTPHHTMYRRSFTLTRQ
jgi:hypothetical protein